MDGDKYFLLKSIQVDKFSIGANIWHLVDYKKIKGCHDRIIKKQLTNIIVKPSDEIFNQIDVKKEKTGIGEIVLIK